MKNKLQIARRHELAAEHRRAEANNMLQRSDNPEYRHRMFLVGFHTIQAELWRKSAREFGE